MNGQSYLVVVERKEDDSYIADIPELDDCRCSAPTVSEAFHRAENVLRRRLSRSGARSRRKAGTRRPIDGLRSALRANAVAAAAIRPRGV